MNAEIQGKRAIKRPEVLTWCNLRECESPDQSGSNREVIGFVSFLLNESRPLACFEIGDCYVAFGGSWLLEEASWVNPITKQ